MTEATSFPSDADLCRHCGKPPEDDGDHTCDCPFDDSNCPIHGGSTESEPTLSKRLSNLERTVADLVKATETQNELLQTISDSVGPAIEGLKSSAIGKMFGI